MGRSSCTPSAVRISGIAGPLVRRLARGLPGVVGVRRRAATSWRPTYPVPASARQPRAERSGLSRRGLRRPWAAAPGRITSPPGTIARSRPILRSTGLVMQRIEPPPLWNSDTSTSTTSKPHSSSRARTRSGQAGITMVEPITIELAQNVSSASASVSTSGSGTRSSSAAADSSSNAAGQTRARVELSGQKARSRWYIPGWVIRSPRTRMPRSAARHPQPGLVGARAVADHQRVPEREGVAGLEVGTDAVGADVRRGVAALEEPGLGGPGLHPALGVAHVAHHHVPAAVLGLDAEAEVHREHHVGGVLALGDGLDRGAEALDGGDQVVPLGPRPGRVGLDGGVHEGVDLVLHAEVARLDLHVAVAPRQRVTHRIPPSSRLPDCPTICHGLCGPVGR